MDPSLTSHVLGQHNFSRATDHSTAQAKNGAKTPVRKGSKYGKQKLAELL